MEVMEDTVGIEVMGDTWDLMEVMVDMIALMVAMEDMDMEREKLKLHGRLRLLQMPLMVMEVMEDTVDMEVMGDMVVLMVAMVDMVALMVAMEDMDMENKTE